MGTLRAALLAATVALSGGIGVAEAAKVCKPVHKIKLGDRLVHPTEALARHDATTSWSMQVAVKHTPMFANWENAANRTFSCSKKTSPIGLNTYTCGVEAMPCAFN